MKKLVIAIGVLTAIGFWTSNTKEQTGVQSILFIGDSNTFLEFSYANMLKAKYPNIRIKIIAKMGAQTTWMLDELTKELKANQYDVVSVLGGSNDIYALSTGGFQATENLLKMYGLIRDNKAQVLAITPPNKNFFIKRTEQKQKALMLLINWISLCVYKNYYIDFWTITNNKNFFISKDGYLHAQKPAHEILSNKIIELLKLK